MHTKPQCGSPRLQPSLDAGFSLIELLIVVAIILVLAAIAIPTLLHSKMAANEATAVENLRTITTASVVYSSTWGNGYPPSLGVLGGAGNTATCDASNLIDPTLATAPNRKSGYTFAYTGQNGNVVVGAGCGAPGFWGYFATATPITVLVTGVRSFCATDSGVINFDTSGATAGSAGACNALPALQ
jgi:type IV pilus assembly protein PilA